MPPRPIPNVAADARAGLAKVVSGQVDETLTLWTAVSDLADAVEALEVRLSALEP